MLSGLVYGYDNDGEWYVRRAELPLMNRGDAAAATLIFRGDAPQRRRGCDVDIPWRRDARLRYFNNKGEQPEESKRPAEKK